MTLLVFDGTDPDGNYQECRFSDASLMANLEAVSQLVTKGWTIYRIQLQDKGKSTVLPRDLFDEHLYSNPLDRLLAEINLILASA